MTNFSENLRNRFVYHSTHFANLASVIQNGFLSVNAQKQRSVTHHTIAADSIQARRATMPVTCGPGGVVHDYVPLYFTKLSPMLLKQVMAKNVDQMLILHFAFPIELLEREDVVFTSSAANSSSLPIFYEDPADLKNLNWPAIELRSWRSKLGTVDVKAERMAEALVHSSLGLADVAFVVVWNDHLKKQVESAFTEAQLPPPAIKFDSPDEQHYFTHFAKELPTDMLNHSIAPGPEWTKFRFKRALRTITEADVVESRPHENIQSLLQKLDTSLETLEETAELIGLESWNDVHKEDVGTHTQIVVANLRNSEQFRGFSPQQKAITLLAAYLHDIGKGPKSRWVDCEGKQKKDDHHPIRSLEMLPRILQEEISPLLPMEVRQLCLLVCYHDIVGDILYNDRDENQLVEIVETLEELDMLIALGRADVTAIFESQSSSIDGLLEKLKERVLKCLESKA